MSNPCPSEHWQITKNTCKVGTKQVRLSLGGFVSSGGYAATQVIKLCYLPIMEHDYTKQAQKRSGALELL